MFKYDNIRLRKIDRNDLPKLLASRENGSESRHSVSALNDEDQERWFNNLDNHPTSPRQLFLIAKEIGGHFSEFGLFKISQIDWVNRNAEVGWDVFKPFRGKGYGKRLVKAGVAFCFNIFNLRRLTAEILETNHASLTCAVHANFTREGLKREAIYKDGNYVNSIVVGILKSEQTPLITNSTTVTGVGCGSAISGLGAIYGKAT